MVDLRAYFGISVFSLLALSVSAIASPPPLIALDVGHSSQSPGATSARGKVEFEFNRDLTSIVHLSISAAGGQAFEIGADGKSVDPEMRPAEASAHGAKFFLSIHHDSVQPQFLEDWTWQDGIQHHSNRYSGFSLFVSRKNKQIAASLHCASAIGASLRAAGFHPSEHHAEKIEGESRAWADQANGVYYYDNLIVLKNAKIPAVLLEAGVIVNEEEELRLLDPKIRHTMGKAVATGLANCGMLK